MKPGWNHVLDQTQPSLDGQTLKRGLADVVRPMRPDEARRFLEIHHAAVRDLAAAYYPASVIEAWAPLSIQSKAIAAQRANRDGDIRLVAEVNGEVVGIGVLDVNTSELQACYVAPAAARQGVGSAIVREIERVATERGLTELHLASSLNAEPFYAALGYAVEGRNEFVLGSGVPMAAVQMRKRLR
jgi:putative acetyltransferase